MFNLVSIPLYEPERMATILPAGESPLYNDALLEILDWVGDDKLVPLDAKAVAALHPYNPLQAWAIYRDGQKVGLIALQAA